MDFFEAAKRRQSIRAYGNREVEPEKLQQILQAAYRAPSAGNLQAYEIIVVRDPGVRQTLARAANGQDFVAAAPLVLVFCANPARSSVKYRKRGEQLYSIQDATIACSFAMLAATAVGLGSVWVGAFDEKAVEAALHLEKSWQPVAILPIGYPAETPELTTRRPIHELVHEM